MPRATPATWPVMMLRQPIRRMRARVAVVNGVQGGFLEISVHPEGVCIDHGQAACAHHGVVAGLDLHVGDVAVDGRDDFGARQVYFGLGEAGEGLCDEGIGGFGGGDVGLAFFLLTC